MAHVRVIEQNGRKSDIQLDRVPVVGDYIANSPNPLEVVRTVLYPPGAPGDAIVYCVEAQNIAGSFKSASTEFPANEADS